jgi:hypothetical protein
MRGLILAFCALSATATAAQSEFWCWDADEILADVVADTVRIRHLAALYNCCPEPITYDVLVGDATIFVEEHTESICDCDCCSNLEVVLADVPPGPWNILFRWFDLETGEWTDEILEIVVPDVGQPLDPVVAGQSWSECIGALDAPATGGDSTGPGTVRVVPNPARGRVAFSVAMSAAGKGTIRVFDAAGRLVSTVFDGVLSVGVRTLPWDPDEFDATGGVYFVRLSGIDFVETRRFLVLP